MNITDIFSPFDKHVLRTPIFPFSFYMQLMKEQSLSKSALKKSFKNPVIHEAIFLASPNFYNELKKWFDGAEKKSKEENKLIFSYLKYLIRLSTRCTPFGLFAGCSVGIESIDNSIKLADPDQNNRHTRLDMDYLVNLADDLSKRTNIRDQLKFYTNNSLYPLDDKFRYVEYENENKKRIHHIVSVNTSEYLELILKNANHGATIQDLASLLIDEETSWEESKEFIEVLIDNQLLICELSPIVSGPDFLSYIINVLSKLKGVSKLIDQLELLRLKLSALDRKIGQSNEMYQEIIEIIDELGADYENKFLFQTDLILNPKLNSINRELKTKVLKGIEVLNNLNQKEKNPRLQIFKKKFYERYEERAVDLSIALDVEMGVGYGNNNANDFNPLIDFLNIKSNAQEEKFTWSKESAFIHKKIVQAISNNDVIVELSENELKDFEIDNSAIPDTFSVMTQILKNNNKISIKYIGGSSAANLMGRFCHGDHKMFEHVNQILAYEKQINNDKIIAEIVHLPQSRVGNILMRPSFRDYEIPYISHSLLPGKYKIDISKIKIRVKNGEKIILFSEEFGCEIIPRLTSAHNYSYDSLPIYNFLCDIQNDNAKNNLSVPLGIMSEQYDYIPRFEYEGIILSEAIWNVSSQDIQPLFRSVDDDTSLKNEVDSFRSFRNLPKLVTLSDGDNELLVNFEHLSSIRMLLDAVKARNKFKLKEFLFDNDDEFTNQIMISYYRKKNDNNE